MERFSDFVTDEEKAFSGDKVRVNDLINKEIIIIRYKVRPSKYKEKSDRCTTVQFKYENSNEEKIFFTGSSVIIEQLEKYKEKLPFYAVIKHIDRYYTLA